MQVLVRKLHYKESGRLWKCSKPKMSLVSKLVWLKWKKLEFLLPHYTHLMALIYSPLIELLSSFVWWDAVLCLTNFIVLHSYTLTRELVL